MGSGRKMPRQRRLKGIIASLSEQALGRLWAIVATVLFGIALYRMWSTGNWLVPDARVDPVGFVGVSGALLLVAIVTGWAIARATRHGHETTISEADGD